MDRIIISVSQGESENLKDCHKINAIKIFGFFSNYNKWEQNVLQNTHDKVQTVCTRSKVRNYYLTEKI